MVGFGQNGYVCHAQPSKIAHKDVCTLHIHDLLVKDYMHANATWLACGQIETYVSTFFAISKRKK